MATKTFYEDIVNNISLDFNNKEIKDIVSAVRELVQRYVEHIDERGIFKITRILPCGSMEEKSSLWKAYKPNLIIYNSEKYLEPDKEREAAIDEIPYIEFDFLAILQKNSICKITRRYGLRNLNVPYCLGCLDVQCNYRWKIEDKYDFTPSFDQDKIPPRRLNQIFRSELCHGISSLCPCISAKRYPRKNAYKLMQTKENSSENCEKCTVDKETGSLQIDTSPEARFINSEDPKKCAFMLLWRSKTQTLIVPNNDTLRPEKQISELHIFIDLLPAYELEDDLTSDISPGEKGFVVPKSCSACPTRHTWRISFNLTESHSILAAMSDGHQKCYKTLKYMLTNVFSWLESYHVKTTFLNHCKLCTRSTEAYDECVTDTLRDLIAAYSQLKLDTSLTRSNLCTGRSDSHYIQVLDELNAVLKTLKTIDTKLDIDSPEPAHCYSPELCLHMLRVGTKWYSPSF